MAHSIYAFVNVRNFKCYVGYTKDMKYRKTAHFAAARTRQSQTYFHKAIRHHGDDSFIMIELIKNIESEERAKALEVRMIAYFRAQEIPLYNLTDGGDGARGYKWSEEKKAAFSESRKGSKNQFYGKTHTSETRAIISAKNSGENSTQYGKPFSQERRDKIGKANSGENSHWHGVSKPWKGISYVFSEEEEQKIKQMRKTMSRYAIEKAFGGKKRRAIGNILDGKTRGYTEEDIALGLFASLGSKAPML